MQGEALVPGGQGLVGRLYGVAARGGEGQERLAVEGPEGGGLVAVVEMVGAEAPRGAPYGTAQDVLHVGIGRRRQVGEVSLVVEEAVGHDDVAAWMDSGYVQLQCGAEALDEGDGAGAPGL